MKNEIIQKEENIIKKLVDILKRFFDTVVTGHQCYQGKMCVPRIDLLRFVDTIVKDYGVFKDDPSEICRLSQFSVGFTGHPTLHYSLTCSLCKRNNTNVRYKDFEFPVVELNKNIDIFPEDLLLTPKHTDTDNVYCAVKSLTEFFGVKIIEKFVNDYEDKWPVYGLSQQMEGIGHFNYDKIGNLYFVREIRDTMMEKILEESPEDGKNYTAFTLIAE